MTAPSAQPSTHRRPRTGAQAPLLRQSAHACVAALLLAVFPAVAQAQATTQAQAAAQAQAAGVQAQAPAQSVHAPGPPPSVAGAPAPQAANSAAPSGQDDRTKTKLPPARERRRAISLYLGGSKLYVDGKFEAAIQDYQKAATLDPTNRDYAMAVEVARSHAVSALVQTAARERLGGNETGARAALSHALELDPTNPEVTQHLYELGEDAARRLAEPLYQQAAGQAGTQEKLLAAAGVRSFHSRSDARILIKQVFQAYGVDAMVDDSVHSSQIRFDLDDADFAAAMRALSLATGTFYVPFDSHRVLVARDDREDRQKFVRNELETVYMAGLDSTQLTEASNLAKNVFGIQQIAANPGASSLTLRAPDKTLDTFNTSMGVLLAGRNQVLLDVRVLDLSHTSMRNSGLQLPQSVTAFNVYAEEQSLLSANAALVQEIISSGLASANDPLAILGILLASGQVSSSLFTNGLALFGGGLTESAFSPQPVTFNFNLNTADSREIDNIQLRLGDGESGTLKDGEKYPIVTSSFSSPSAGLPNIPGLTGAGNSGALSSLLSSLGGAATIPMIQYQDLGLTLKVTPNVLRDGDVALTIDLTIDGLSGATSDGDPILNNEAYSSVVTVKEGDAVEVASELDQSQTRAVSGTPGLSQIPGLNSATDDNNIQKDYSTLLVLITPHVVRSTQPAGHTPMMLVEKGATTQ